MTSRARCSCSRSGGVDAARQHRNPVLGTLAVAHEDLVAHEFDVLDASRMHSRMRMPVP